MISLIAAMAENRVIGKGNKIPWNLPSDRKRFHALTRGHPIILGRKTFESIGRPLSNRKNIVLTRQNDYRAEGCIIACNLEAAFVNCIGVSETFICGGENVFRETISRTDQIYLSILHAHFEGDAFFPEIPPYFEEVERKSVVDVISYDVVLFARK